MLPSFNNVTFNLHLHDQKSFKDILLTSFNNKSLYISQVILFNNTSFENLHLPI